MLQVELGGVLGRLWGGFGRPWGTLGRSWGVLGWSWGAWGGVGTENSRPLVCALEHKNPQNHTQDRSRTPKQLEKRPKNENRAPVYTGALLLGLQPALFSLFWGVLGRSWGHVGVVLEGFGSDPEKKGTDFLASGRLLSDLWRVFSRLAVSCAPFCGVPGPT